MFNMKSAFYMVIIFFGIAIIFVISPSVSRINIKQKPISIKHNRQNVSTNIIEENNKNERHRSQERIYKREEKVETIQDIEKQISEKIKQVKDDVVVDVEQKDVVKVEPNIDIPVEYWFKWLDNPNMPDSGQMYQDAKEKFQSRRNWLLSVCKYMDKKGYKLPYMEKYEDQYKRHAIVNHDHHMLYCYVPKVANTNFRRVLLGLQGVVQTQDVPYIDGEDVYIKYGDKYTFLQDFPESQQQYMLQTYIKFMVVRDPLERLLSAYRNKYFHPNLKSVHEFLNKREKFYREHSHLKNRPGISIRENISDSNIPLQFREFLIFVTDTYDEGAFLNEHFTLASQLCDPCRTKINFIIKYETLYEDVDYIFQELKIKIPFPGRNDNFYKENTKDVEFNYYKEMPQWLLRKVWNILKYDYVIFGFQVPKWFKQLLTQNVI